MMQKILVIRKEYKDKLGARPKNTDKYADYFLAIRTELMLALLDELGAQNHDIHATKLGDSIIAVTAYIPIDGEKIAIRWTGQQLSLDYRNQKIICPDPWINKYWLAQAISDLIV